MLIWRPCTHPLRQFQSMVCWREIQAMCHPPCIKFWWGYFFKKSMTGTSWLSPLTACFFSIRLSVRSYWWSLNFHSIMSWELSLPSNQSFFQCLSLQISPPATLQLLEEKNRQACSFCQWVPPFEWPYKQSSHPHRGLGQGSCEPDHKEHRRGV